MSATTLETLITLIIGALITFILRYFLVGIQERRQRNSRRELIAGLIGDEIEYRWRRHIRKDILSFLEAGADMESAREFADRVITVRDFPVMHLIYEHLFESNVFIRRSTMSILVHAYITMHDVCDGHSVIQKLFERLENTQSELKKKQICEQIEKEWQRARQTLRQLDVTLDVLREAVDVEYKHYIEDGEKVLSNVAPELAKRYRDLNRPI